MSCPSLRGLSCYIVADGHGANGEHAAQFVCPPAEISKAPAMVVNNYLASESWVVHAFKGALGAIFFCIFQGVLVTQPRSPCFLR